MPKRAEYKINNISHLLSWLCTFRVEMFCIALIFYFDNFTVVDLLCSICFETFTFQWPKSRAESSLLATKPNLIINTLDGELFWEWLCCKYWFEMKGLPLVDLDLIFFFFKLIIKCKTSGLQRNFRPVRGDIQFFSNFLPFKLALIRTKYIIHASKSLFLCWMLLAGSGSSSLSRIRTVRLM
jgi:hypothetical protein